MVFEVTLLVIIRYFFYGNRYQKRLIEKVMLCVRPLGQFLPFRKHTNDRDAALRSFVNPGPIPIFNQRRQDKARQGKAKQGKLIVELVYKYKLKIG